MLIDGQRVVIGSLALTALSLDFRREVAIETTDPAVVSDIKSLFRTLGVTAAPSGVVPAAAGGASC
jgi:phosphatidylserine/phosphatidylglycerophosphate/cardiolipin synthase-like enzyme